MASPTQSSESFDEISHVIWNHLEERDWLDAVPRNLATSIVLEASELLEHYQWADEPVGSKQALADELADIFIYGFQFAHINEIDIAEAIRHKLAKAAKKYPASHFKGKQGAERSKAWMEAKTKYKKDGL